MITTSIARAVRVADPMIVDPRLVNGDICHGELLARVRIALGVAWVEVSTWDAPRTWVNMNAAGKRVILRNGTEVVERTYTTHESRRYPTTKKKTHPEIIRGTGFDRRGPTFRWSTWRDWVIAGDLEDLADELGVLAEGEHLADAPMCSRCRSWEVAIDTWGQYAKQCERCTTWSRATRADPNRCADCRKPFPPLPPGHFEGAQPGGAYAGESFFHRAGREGSRCSRCYTARKDRFAAESRDQREHRLAQQAHYRATVPPWERRPRDG
jgi:hypothetical protein